ncbi:hypothetical protein QSU92_11390 [Microbacterium sp. ET2]|uniref:hypothetical protein n=1 Tax=Microbacterium albipurpureum TaxID=3050384 RepID=UPI00259CEB4E|nr:hypothetical protein [Microbacterium sp. ET2 (Ac-2212)]WJL94574.1 hypothetical protein QSU92_11390 [Microbacterium sp. ET2 (Ac-2212)]
MTDLPDERTAPSKRQAPAAAEPVEQTVLSRRQAPVETTAPSVRRAPAEETVVSGRARSRGDGVDEWTVRTSDARSTGVIRPAPDAGGEADADGWARTARRPDTESGVYAPRADTAARVARTVPAAQPAQPVVDAARAAAERRRRSRLRAAAAVVVGVVVLAAAVVAIVALVTLPA